MTNAETRDMTADPEPCAEDREMVFLERITKSFDGKRVLEGVDLSIRAGETMVVIGRSGEGKSVLLKHIIGLLKPDTGKVFVDGQEISRLSEKALVPVRRKVGMVFQGSALFDSLNVRENVGFQLDQEGEVDAAEIDRRVLEELQHVSLEGVLEKKPAELSGGMKRRVGLARTTIMRPKVILYDEPTTGLDPITADSINELIVRMQRDLCVTSIVVTHDMASAYKVGDRIALLHRGRIVFIGTPDEVRKTENPQVRQFIEGRASGPLTGG
jgi:phospholipid/cholesterol/gamma-HCH transport system ATP-binding protein